MKYTRGPWNATGSPQVWANDGSKVAHASNHENARLISAAPDMYEALNQALESFRSMYYAIENGADAEDIIANKEYWPLTKIREALAKAEGR